MGRRYSKIWGFVTNPLKKPKKLCSASTLLSSFLLRNEIMGNQRNDICKNSIEEIIYVCQNPGGVFSVINTVASAASVPSAMSWTHLIFENLRVLSSYQKNSAHLYSTTLHHSSIFCFPHRTSNEHGFEQSQPKEKAQFCNE